MGIVEGEGGGGHPMESSERQVKEFRIYSPDRHDGTRGIFFETGLSGISVSELAPL